VREGDDYRAHAVEPYCRTLRDMDIGGRMYTDKRTRPDGGSRRLDSWIVVLRISVAAAEGDGVKLTARWMGDVLVTPFKVDDYVLVSSVRLRGDILEHETLTIDDQPSIKGVLPLIPRGIQRLVLKRQSKS